MRGARRRRSPPSPLIPIIPIPLAVGPGLVCGDSSESAIFENRHPRKDQDMKLLRYGPRGQEKPGMIDRDGQLRDLSGVIKDLTPDALSPASLDKLRQLKPASLAAVSGSPRIGACVANVPKLVCVGLN